MLTIGYIGNGKSVNRYHLPFVLQRETIKVKTIYSRNPENDIWEKIPQVHYTTDLQELLNDSEIEMIVVATMQDSHYEYAKMVLDAGKHVLVEKPFMMTSNEAKEIFAYAKEKGLLVQCYQNRRFDSDFLTMQKVIKSGKLGDIIEVEMNYDYFRPEVPLGVEAFDPFNSFLYGHGCHTIDQAVSFFGAPDNVHYDVRQLLGKGRFNDYFDIDLYYDRLKVSIRSSFFRLKMRPSFIVYGKKGMFEKTTIDRQEEHLKLFYMPGEPGFGIDLPEHYGTLTYIDDAGVYHEEKVISENGDYGRIYDGMYRSIRDGAEKIVKDEETMLVMEMLETGISQLD
ncbi:Gfo/Idh/MocA family oxidoreductase [Culicoidibacter larvae]|uniref:NAD(P)-dependent oxidoreductase n=1 Tax=Culicoidibacter larvae TaxID=2579976 RepID=A0A5R8QCY2_9FIRM|nr:Gfo/Idh/MocA family oxidoreductase [Culicoidibacter larvae]TLG74194.1 NAD(P)-dependent oxidoreductase [Culicoidibacter larvae]